MFCSPISDYVGPPSKKTRSSPTEYDDEDYCFICQRYEWRVKSLYSPSDVEQLVGKFPENDMLLDRLTHAKQKGMKVLYHLKCYRKETSKKPCGIKWMQ